MLHVGTGEQEARELLQEHQLALEVADRKLSGIELAEQGCAVAGAIHRDRRRPGKQSEEVHVFVGDAAGLVIPDVKHAEHAGGSADRHHRTGARLILADDQLDVADPRPISTVIADQSGRPVAATAPATPCPTLSDHRAGISGLRNPL